MQVKSVKRLFGTVLLICTVLPLYGWDDTDSNDYRTLVREGDEALKQNRFPEAARSFQRAVDLNPSSAKAHEGLGVALLQEISAGNLRPSANGDVAERAEGHLKQAAEFSPSAPAPLLQLSALDALLAERAADAEERADRYKKAQDLLKQVISLEPSKPEIYLRLANLERDEFGPAVQQAKARFSKNAGPIPDVNLRRELQQQYAAILDDAISNAQHASEMNGNLQRPLLLLSQLFRERALLRDTQEQYATDMHSSADWQRQFLATGGHIDTGFGRQN